MKNTAFTISSKWILFSVLFSVLLFSGCGKKAEKEMNIPAPPPAPNVPVSLDMNNKMPVPPAAPQLAMFGEEKMSINSVEMNINAGTGEGVHDKGYCGGNKPNVPNAEEGYEIVAEGKGCGACPNGADNNNEYCLLKAGEKGTWMRWIVGAACDKDGYRTWNANNGAFAGDFAGALCQSTHANGSTTYDWAIEKPKPLNILNITIEGIGSVTSSNGEINCSNGGNGQFGDCQNPGELFILSYAAPTAGWKFGSWGESCPEGKVDVSDGNKNCTATFVNTAEAANTITVYAVGGGFIEVEYNDKSETCMDTQTCVYKESNQYTLTAKANEGKQFSNWNQDCNSNTNTETISVVDGDKNCTATFENETTDNLGIDTITGRIMKNGKIVDDKDMVINSEQDATISLDNGESFRLDVETSTVEGVQCTVNDRNMSQGAGKYYILLDNLALEQMHTLGIECTDRTKNVNKNINVTLTKEIEDGNNPADEAVSTSPKITEVIINNEDFQAGEIVSVVLRHQNANGLKIKWAASVGGDKNFINCNTTGTPNEPSCQATADEDANDITVTLPDNLKDGNYTLSITAWIDNEAGSGKTGTRKLSIQKEYSASDNKGDYDRKAHCTGAEPPSAPTVEIGFESPDNYSGKGCNSCPNGSSNGFCTLEKDEKGTWIRWIPGVSCDKNWRSWGNTNGKDDNDIWQGALCGSHFNNSIQNNYHWKIEKPKQSTNNPTDSGTPKITITKPVANERTFTYENNKRVDVEISTDINATCSIYKKDDDTFVMNLAGKDTQTHSIQNVFGVGEYEIECVATDDSTKKNKDPLFIVNSIDENGGGSGDNEKIKITIVQPETGRNIFYLNGETEAEVNVEIETDIEQSTCSIYPKEDVTNDIFLSDRNKKPLIFTDGKNHKNTATAPSKNKFSVGEYEVECFDDDQTKKEASTNRISFFEVKTGTNPDDSGGGSGDIVLKNEILCEGKSGGTGVQIEKSTHCGSAPQAATFKAPELGKYDIFALIERGSYEGNEQIQSNESVSFRINGEGTQNIDDSEDTNGIFHVSAGSGVDLGSGNNSLEFSHAACTEGGSVHLKGLCLVKTGDAESDPTNSDEGDSGDGSGETGNGDDSGAGDNNGNGEGDTGGEGNNNIGTVDKIVSLENAKVVIDEDGNIALHIGDLSIPNITLELVIRDDDGKLTQTIPIPIQQATANANMAQINANGVFVFVLPDTLPAGKTYEIQIEAFDTNGNSLTNGAKVSRVIPGNVLPVPQPTDAGDDAQNGVANPEDDAGNGAGDDKNADDGNGENGELEGIDNNDDFNEKLEGIHDTIRGWLIRNFSPSFGMLSNENASGNARFIVGDGDENTIVWEEAYVLNATDPTNIQWNMIPLNRGEDRMIFQNADGSNNTEATGWILGQGKADVAKANLPCSPDEENCAWIGWIWKWDGTKYMAADKTCSSESGTACRWALQLLNMNEI